MLPSKIKIGGITYKVYEDDPKYATDGSVQLGEVTYSNPSIYINSTMDSDVKVQTMFHEMIHAIMHMMGRKELNEDEYFIDALAYNIHQIFKDNGWKFE